MRIVQFISKKLTPEETRYHTTDREALAVVRCLEECRWLVMQAASLPVILYTDHKALLSILQGETTSVRIAGWQLRLGEYNLDIVHVKGTENGLADGLSRTPIRALHVGIIGKEQSYLSVMTISPTDSGVGFVLKQKRKPKGKEKEKDDRQEESIAVQSIVRQDEIGSLGENPKITNSDKEKDLEDLKEQWRSWLGEEWYKEVVWFLLFGLTEEEKASAQLANRIRKKSASFRLIQQNSIPASGQTANRGQTVNPASGQTAIPTSGQTAIPASGQTANRGQTTNPASGQTAIPAPG